MKLYRFRHSPFARKVQTVLELLGLRHDVVDVAYADRNELATLTGGYVYVPVLVDDDGSVITESREICRRLLERPGAHWLAPSPLEGPIWGYHDFADNVLEDIAFRIASPDVREQWPTPGERALYTMNKERKFGAGCVERWRLEREQLIGKLRHLLAPSFVTLEQQRFLFGERPSLADAALHGQSLMLEAGSPKLLAQVAEPLAEHARRMRDWLARG
jgi:glutathione S-transferase